MNNTLEGLVETVAYRGLSWRGLKMGFIENFEIDFELRRNFEALKRKLEENPEKILDKL